MRISVHAHPRIADFPPPRFGVRSRRKRLVAHWNHWLDSADALVGQLDESISQTDHRFFQRTVAADFYCAQSVQVRRSADVDGRAVKHWRDEGWLAEIGDKIKSTVRDHG